MTPFRERIERLKTTAQLGKERRQARASGRPVVGLVGAHNLQNLGDDALHAAAVALLPDRAIATYSWYLHENRLRRVGLTGGFFESVALGGGTLINEFALDVTRDALKSGAALWTLGTGVGSSGYSQPPEVELRDWAPLLRDFSRLGVRGPRSLAKLSSLGITHGHVVGDLALAFARDDFKPAKARVLFNVFCGHYGDAEGEYAALQALPDVLRELAHDFQIVPVAMNPADEKPTRLMLQRAGLDNLQIARPETFQAFADLAEECAFSVAVRLHAAILGCCLGVPPLMLGYRDKCLDFMESVELEPWHVALESAQPNDILERARELRAQADDLRPLVLARSQALRDSLRAYTSEYRRDPNGRSSSMVN